MLTGRVDQLVFGYRDGHELVASSTALETRTIRELLPHVDASFDDAAPHYLVGSALQTVDRYLLARIWPASEVSRPGAVWAHGLLLDQAVLGQSAAQWLHALRKPSFDTLADFRKPAALPRVRPMDEPVASLAVGLAWAALGAPDQQPVVLWPAVQEAEPALLALLDALPAAAKWRLSFRTRGRARLGASRYELQVASTVAGRPQSQQAPVLDLRRPLEQAPPIWAELTKDTGPAAELRSFLRRYGTREAETRAQVAGLAQTWTALHQRRSPDDVLLPMLHSFPSPQTVADLRAELLGEAHRHQNLWLLSESQRLATLLEHENAFNFDKLQFRPRVAAFWYESREEALRLAVRAAAYPLSSRGPEVLDILAEVAESATVAALAEHDEVFNGVLARRPELLLKAAAWTDLPLAPALQALERHAASLDTEPLAGALVKSGRSDLITAVIDDDLVTLDALVQGTLAQAKPEGRLRDLAKLNVTRFSHWLEAAELSPADALVMLRVLPQDVLALRPIAKWRESARAVHRVSDRDGTASAAALLALALRTKGAGADGVLREAFAPVHRALVEERLKRQTWERLDPLLPDADHWDRAGRLRHALLIRAQAHNWDEHELAYALQGAGEHGARLVDLVPRKHPFRRIVEAAVDGLADLIR